MAHNIQLADSWAQPAHYHLAGDQNTQKKSDAFLLLGSCSKLSVIDVVSWDTGVWDTVPDCGVLVGVWGPLAGVL